MAKLLYPSCPDPLSAVCFLECLGWACEENGQSSHFLFLQYYVDSQLLGKNKEGTRVRREQSKQGGQLEFLNTTKALVAKWAGGDQNFRISVNSQDKDS